MNTRMICTECPKGCALSVTVHDGRVISVRGNECNRGVHFAHQEIENPKRLLTSTVCAEGLSVRMVPVRTDRPIPKDKLQEGMALIHTLRIKDPVNIGEVIVTRFLDLDVNLISTRSVK
ncbi:MAG: DUF1667 domain-containing protein [Candidatus Omnitrophica bacterium]|nr:DUF1667 domain-containing protein [Candidatus Omnitrophota bacterium]